MDGSPLDADVKERESVLRLCRILEDSERSQDDDVKLKDSPGAVAVNPNETPERVRAAEGGSLSSKSLAYSTATVASHSSHELADSSRYLYNSGELKMSAVRSSTADRNENHDQMMDYWTGNSKEMKTKGKDKHKQRLLSQDRTIEREAIAIDMPFSMPTLQRSSLERPPSVPGAIACKGIGNSEQQLPGAIACEGIGSSEQQLLERLGEGDDNFIGDSPEATSLQFSLPEAEQVEESALDLFRPRAQMFDQEMEESARRKRRTATANWIIGAILLVIVAITAVVGSVVGKKKRQDTATTDASSSLAPSDAPTEAPLTVEENMLSLLPRETQRDIGASFQTPQKQAFEWIVDDPYLANYTDHRLIQRYALATFFFSTTSRTRTTNWFEADAWLDYDQHECDWYSRPTHGFYTTPDVEDFLLYNYTNASPPCSSSSDGNTFEHLWLKKNNLIGTIPEELYLLTSLKSISLPSNKIEGTISTRMGLLTDLEAVDLSVNSLTGTIPTEISQTTLLEYLWLYNNPITGQVPSELGLLSNSLMYLELDTTPITGPLPTEIELGNCPDMIIMAIDRNFISGTIPSEVGNLQVLERLHLAYNLLSGTLASELGDMPSLWSLSLDDNMLSGTIPTEFGGLTDMWIIRFPNNLLTGTIPTEIGLWQTWPWAWDFSDNNFSGNIPSELGLNQGLGHAIFNNNNFTGHIPTQLGLLKTLDVLRLDSNKLSGGIPTELGILDWYWDNESNATVDAPNNITEMWLHDNLLTGLVPTSFSQLRGLSILTLHNNSGLLGEVPSDLCELESWETGRAYDGWWEKEAADVTYEPPLGISVDCVLVTCNCSVCICGEEWQHTEAQTGGKFIT